MTGFSPKRLFYGLADKFPYGPSQKYSRHYFDRSTQNTDKKQTEQKLKNEPHWTPSELSYLYRTVT